MFAKFVSVQYFVFRYVFSSMLICFCMDVSANVNAVNLDVVKGEKGITFIHAKKPLKSVVLIGHGLNNPPEVMYEIGRRLAEQGHEAVFLRFKGHDLATPDTEIREVTSEDWLQNVDDALAVSTKLSVEHKLPLNFLGFSLGCLMFEAFQNFNPGKYEINKRVYLAPALGINGYSYLVKYVPFAKRMIIPTQNREDARANSGTSIQAYQVLFKTLDELLSTKMAQSKLPTKVILSDDDELISVKKTKDIIQRYSLSDYWSVNYVSKSKEARDHSFNHFFLTKLSLGEDEFPEMMKVVSDFLN